MSQTDANKFRRLERPLFARKIIGSLLLTKYSCQQCISGKLSNFISGPIKNW